MAVKIKLMRLGKIRQPYYRIVVADSRTRRNGKAIETIGKYHPKAEPSLIVVDSDRAQYWLGVGAQPTEPVQRLFEVTGDWQRFKGLPGTEGTLRVAQPKPSKQELFNVALAEAGSEPVTEATTPRRRTGGRKPDEARSDARPGAKPDAKPGASSDAKANAGSAAKPDARSGASSDAKADAGSDAKPDAGSGASSDAKPDAGSDAKPDEASSDAKPDAGSDAKPDASDAKAEARGKASEADGAADADAAPAESSEQA